MAAENLGAGGTPAQQSKVIKYKVTCTCYWNDILWHEDDKVELASNLTPPKDYFEKI
jgi:hypothetical protein